MPERVQLSRKKGWRMPLNTVKVSRPGVFGNPFAAEGAIDSGFATEKTARAFVVQCFADWINYPGQRAEKWWQGPESDKRRAAILDGLPGLRGKNLACWCRLDQPCHADVLLELANPPPDPDEARRAEIRKGVG
jgi:hypothetical protein